MTREELLKLYPRSSESFLRANSDSPARALPGAVPKQNSRKSVALADAGKKASPTRCPVRLTILSRRIRLLDPDNLVGGSCYLINALRYEKLIPDDSPRHIILEVRQEQVATKAQEETIVCIAPAGFGDSRARVGGV